MADQVPEKFVSKFNPDGPKKKILTISDHPLIPSGVGWQTRFVIEGLLRTGRYRFVSWGMAMAHPDKRPQRVFPELYGEDWTIYPFEGQNMQYGNRDLMRQFLINERPDALFIVTDPRFYTWLFEMADEIRANCPIVYWHVWDNDPTPEYNQAYYECIDGMAPLSLKTYGLLQDLRKLGKYGGDFRYIPHAVPADVFKPVDEELVQKFRRERFGPHADKKFLLFWNNRNARRKMTGDVIDTFAQFARTVGKKNVALLMQTQPRDPEGQDLLSVSKKFGIDDCILMSEGRVPSEDINMFLNSCDCTINIANNEGFGLGTLESLMAGTPIIVHMTGGLQFQVGDWWKGLDFFGDQAFLTELARHAWKNKTCDWWGIPVFPVSRSCTGSQPIPYIYDDRVAHVDVVTALLDVYEMGRAKRKALGLRSREWAEKTFNMEKMVRSWDELMAATIERHRAPAPRLVTI